MTMKKEIKTTAPLKGVSDIRRFFYKNEVPIYFISATNFNLLGIDEWVKNFHYITYVDCYDGAHPNVFVPAEIAHPEFESIEDINNYLLEHKEVIDYINSFGPNPVAVFLMFGGAGFELKGLSAVRSLPGRLGRLCFHWCWGFGLFNGSRALFLCYFVLNRSRFHNRSVPRRSWFRERISSRC